MFSCRYENAFLVSLVGLRPEKYFWTGLSNTEDRNTFKWTTERNWGYGEPNNHNDSEHCTEMDPNLRMRWNDQHCDAYNSWICQLRKGETG
uniref:C-type lectin domain-containing protein n=1 Tax=Haplochromis burtoni TaxID=8153 RepID=A0A3Q2WEC5_HAPBU